jgi:hypothetical protein
VNIWSEKNWSTIGKQFNKHSEFPLPGQTGVCVVDKINSLDNIKQTSSSSSSSIAFNQSLNTNLKDIKKIDELNNYDLFHRPLPNSKHIETLKQIEYYQKEMNDKYSDEQNSLTMNTLLELS